MGNCRGCRMTTHEMIKDFARKMAKRAHDEIKAEGWDAKKYQYTPKK